MDFLPLALLLRLESWVSKYEVVEIIKNTPKPVIGLGVFLLLCLLKCRVRRCVWVTISFYKKIREKIAFTLSGWSCKMAVSAPALVFNRFNARPIFKALFLLWLKIHVVSHSKFLVKLECQSTQFQNLYFKGIKIIL